MKKVIASSASPEIAVFWYIPKLKKFIGDRGNLNDCIYYGDYGQLSVDHFLRWDKWRSAYRLPRVQYDHYPRGRVMFNSKIHKFVVVCDPCIANSSELRKSLCYEYNLDPDGVIWDVDEHYTCAACRGRRS